MHQPDSTHFLRTDDDGRHVLSEGESVAPNTRAIISRICELEHYGEPFSALERMPSDSELSESSIMSDMMDLDAFFQSLKRTSDDVLMAFIRTLVRSISPAQVTPVMSDVLACLRTDTARLVLDAVSTLIPSRAYLALCALMEKTPHDTTPVESQEAPMSPILRTVVQALPHEELLDVIPSIVQVEPETVAVPIVKAALDVLPTNVTPKVIHRVVQSIPHEELLDVIPSIVQVEPETVAAPIVKAALDVLPTNVTPKVIHRVVQSLLLEELFDVIPSIVQIDPEMVAAPIVKAALDVLPTNVTPEVIHRVVQSIPPDEFESVIPSIVQVESETVASLFTRAV
jgi:hypothetical protein